ncbi:hypothetical protein H4R21_006242, partial [Coemansia helicoidea]
HSGDGSGDDHGAGLREVRSYHIDGRPAQAPPLPPPRSLPNVRLAAGTTNRHAGVIRARGPYVGLYADSFSSDEDAADAPEIGAGVVACATTAAAPRAQPRTGAARLTGMVRPRAPTQPRQPSQRTQPTQPSQPSQPSRPETPEAPDTCCLELDSDAERVAEPVPGRRLRRIPPGETRALAGAETAAAVVAVAVEPPLEGEELNGLMAPGARGDEKQRARTAGGPLRRLLWAVDGRRREREAKLFRPVVLGAAAGQQARASGEMPWLLDSARGQADDEPERLFPFCCCAPRYCVAATFVAVLVGALVGFLAWPRVPTVSIGGLRALAPATVVYDGDRSLYGLRMPVRLTYEIHSGNFYPLRIRAARVRGFDGATGNRIIDTNLTNLDVAPLRLQFHTATADIDYLTSDPADPALADLFGKCAPRAAAVGARPIGHPAALSVRFQITVD